MILNFKDSTGEDIYNGIFSKKALRCSPELWPLIRRKLDMLNAAHELKDLQAPPGNRLEAMRGGLKGLHSIRVNDRLRVLFRWSDGNAGDVQIIDYH